jgi:argininosuccinate lyase
MSQILISSLYQRILPQVPALCLTRKTGCFELIRGKCNKIQALPYEITLITNNLPSGYHRDLQLLKKVVSGNSKPETCLDIIFSPSKTSKWRTISWLIKIRLFVYRRFIEWNGSSGIPFRDAYKPLLNNWKTVHFNLLKNKHSWRKYQ